MRQVRSFQGGARTPQLEPVQVRVQGSRPHSIEWRGRTFTVVQVLSTWCIEGRWWLDAGHTGARRRYFRLCLQTPRSTQVCVEVFRSGDGDWKLWQVAD